MAHRNEQAMEELRPDATGIYVAAQHAPRAIEEAIEAEIPLIVAVAEHVPLHDMLRVCNLSSHEPTACLSGQS
jgi:succinyl-CoA synthetase alpha subunit